MQNLIHHPLPRRNFLRTGMLGGLGLSLPELLRAEAEASHNKTTFFGRFFALLMIFGFKVR